MNKYLTTKLAEEAAEVAKAACKVLLHQDKQSRQALLSEMADVQAMLDLSYERIGYHYQRRFDGMVKARVEREVKKGKA